MNRFIFYILAITSSACFRPAIAQTPPAEDSVLRVGVSPVFPPMVFKQGKELAGVEVDLARELGQELGRKVVFVELPWEDQTEALADGRTDIIMSSMSITAARKWVVDFSEPYFVIGQMALVRSEDQARYLLGFPTRPPGTVGVLKATTGEFLVQHDFPKTSRKAYASETQAVEALKKKKIDLFISDSPLIYYLAGTHASDGLSAVPFALSQETLGWAVRKGNERLLASVNDFLKKASQNGKLNQTFRRWMAIK